MDEVAGKVGRKLAVCFQNRFNAPVQKPCVVLDFFNVSEGTIITRDTRNNVLEGGRKIAVVPA